MLCIVLRCFLHITPYFLLYVTATTEIYTLSLHDALPISGQRDELRVIGERFRRDTDVGFSCDRLFCDLHRIALMQHQDRKSTRLNSSHLGNSYAVFCLKKKKHKNCDIIKDY